MIALSTAELGKCEAGLAHDSSQLLWNETHPKPEPKPEGACLTEAVRHILPPRKWNVLTEAMLGPDICWSQELELGTTFCLAPGWTNFIKGSQHLGGYWVTQPPFCFRNPTPWIPE